MKRIFLVVLWILATSILCSAQATIYFPHIANGVNAPAAVFLQRTLQYGSNAGRGPGRQSIPIGFDTQDFGAEIRHGFAAEWRPSGQHLVKDATESPDVGTLIGRKPAQLFRGHIGQRPNQDVGRQVAGGKRGGRI